MKKRLRAIAKSFPTDLEEIIYHPIFVYKVRKFRERWGIPDLGFENDKQYQQWMDTLTKKRSKDKTISYPFWDYRKDFQNEFPNLDNFYLNAIEKIVIFAKIYDRVYALHKPRAFVEQKGDKAIVCVEVDTNTTKKEYFDSFSQVLKLQKTLPDFMKGKTKISKKLIRNKEIMKEIEKNKNESPNHKKTILGLAMSKKNISINPDAYIKVKQRFDKKTKTLLKRIVT